MKRYVTVALVFVLLSAGSSSAQFAVFDPLMLVQNIIVRVVRGEIFDLVSEHADILRRMNRGISLFKDKTRWIAVGMPLWRTQFIDPPLVEVSLDWYSAINSGDPLGIGYSGVVRVTLDPAGALLRLARRNPLAAEVFRRELATLQIADSIAITGINQTGSIRASFQRHAELDALEALEADIHNPDLGTTQAAEVLVGASLMQARQSRQQVLLSRAIAEEYVVSNKRLRDIAVVTMNSRTATPARVLIGGAADIANFHP